MELRIADTFTDSLAVLSNDEQKAVKNKAFDLQMNPANPGFKFHKIERAKDPNFWSARVDRDLRIILHKTRASLLLCYVGHHDDAYQWAERRRLETHPRTGAAQLVEIRETIEEITIPRYVAADEAPASKAPLFAGVSDDDLLRYGVPEGWLADVRRADEDTVLDLADHLPAEAAEALLDLATGATPRVSPPAVAGTDPFDHPDAQRRFRVMNNTEELTRALEYPWEKWTLFLHPEQRSLVEQDYAGPAKVAGSAGTGKTIVALHRAVFLARTNPHARILLTTFSDALANALQTKLRRLISSEPGLGERIEVHAIKAVGRRLYELNVGKAEIAGRDEIRAIIKEASDAAGDHNFSMTFLMSEWADVADAWQLTTWEAYRDVVRLGRKTRLPEKRRAALWAIFEDVRSRLDAQRLITWSDLFGRLAARMSEMKQPPFDFAVVDEAQDVSIAQLRFLAALGGRRPNGLFFAGDLGQRIFQQPFSWKSLNVDIRGRSRTLRINYRTSHQIRMQADRLLAPKLSDVDGNAEQRDATISIFNGPRPVIMTPVSAEDEIAAVSEWISERLNAGASPHEIGVFVRSAAELDRAVAAVEKTGTPNTILDDSIAGAAGRISVSTMHLAKGLEFRAVAVMACDDEVTPLQARIETVADETDLEEVYNTERHLLYVACTRARDHLLVSGVDPASEFLDDMRG